MRMLLVAVMVCPLAAFAQAPGGGQGQAPERGARQAQQQQRDPEKMAKRMRLARTLGLAEVLDLDAPAALKLGDAIGKFDDRRLAAHKQLRDARDVLRRAASGEKVAPAEVDQAIQRGLEARGQLQAIDRETVATVTKDLSPDRKARAVLFLERFQRRFGHGPGMHGQGHGNHGRMGFGPSEGMEPPGMMGMGPGRNGMGPGWQDDDDDLE